MKNSRRHKSSINGKGCVLKRIIHIWEIPANKFRSNDCSQGSISVKLHSAFAKTLANEIKSVKCYRKWMSEILECSESYASVFLFRLKHQMFVPAHILFKIVEKLGFRKEMLERRIFLVKSSFSNHAYRLKFPIEFTPLHLRIVAHLLGDGHKCKDSQRGVFIQKNLMYMTSLLRRVLGASPKPYDVRVTIPALMLKVASTALSLNTTDFKKAEFIRKVQGLPADYKFQLIFAVVSDEGNIHKTIRVGVTNKALLQAFAQLLNALDIPNSGVRKRKNYYEIAIYKHGVIRLYKESKRAIAEYGEVAGLWEKQEQIKRRAGMLLMPQVKSEKVRELIKFFILNKNRPAKLQDIKKRRYIRRMVKRGLLERVGWMTYKLNEHLVEILKEFPEIAVQRWGASL